MVPFEYSAKLTAVMKLHGITDPHTAWTVFSARAEALSDYAIGFRPLVSTAPAYRAVLGNKIN